MKTASIRALGFFLPTAFVVTALHVARDGSAGEWFDGLASSAWFALVFLAGALAVAWIGRRADATATVSAARAVASGLALGCVTWVLVWAFWALPVTQPLREHALLVNSLAMLAAALAGLRIARSRHTALA